MIDVLVKVLLLAFALAVGFFFAIWPVQVMRRFDIWNGRSVKTVTGGASSREYAHAASLRQLGILLIALTCYLIYFWIRTGSI